MKLKPKSTSNFLKKFFKKFKEIIDTYDFTIFEQ